MLRTFLPRSSLMMRHAAGSGSGRKWSLSASASASSSLSHCRSLSATATATSEQKLFDKVLIANRGEIAERVMRTCRNLGIKTVAIYSTADSMAPFVKYADEAVCVGPAAASDSYLNVERVISVLKDTGAQAVHPGYGFLSENADFCHQIELAGAKFLGPPVPAIQTMGDKLESKALAVNANVSTIPGYDEGPVETVEQALQICNEIVQYPVLLKAAAGGGGKGMRVCYNDTDIREAWRIAKAEAIKFFSDDRLLLEKYIERPHHIEFQVMAAKNGEKTDVAVFPERECSIQRRNQKVIEETPSVLLTEETRTKMAEQVRRLCQKVGYESAGTVEFLVDEKQQFYFLEMNTRLQVEHPITEAVTDVDLVEAMLHVGAGLGLPDNLRPYTDTIVPYKGHAIEARIYAEDPLRHFLPSTGPLTQYHEPAMKKHTKAISDGRLRLTRDDKPYVRLDSGVAPGHVVSPYYDPMLSKLVFYDTDRASAIAGLQRSLDEYVIEGVQHNAKLVQSVLREPAFKDGATPTSFLPTHYPDGFKGVQLNEQEMHQFVVAGTVIGMANQTMLEQPPLTGTVDDDYDFVVRLGGQFGTAYGVHLLPDENAVAVSPWDESNGTFLPPFPPIKYSDLEYSASHPVAKISIDSAPRSIQVLEEKVTGELRMQMYGAEMDVLLQSPREFELSRSYMHEPAVLDTAGMVLSPMPGLLISYAVKPGDVVDEGQELCIVESMKMQNMIRSPRAGTIGACKCALGASLKVDEVILTFADDTAEEAAAMFSEADKKQ